MSVQVTLLSRIHHRNLVQFLGYCQEEGKNMLVYEFMHNGTLKEHLYGMSNSITQFYNMIFYFGKLILVLHQIQQLGHCHMEGVSIGSSVLRLLKTLLEVNQLRMNLSHEYEYLFYKKKISTEKLRLVESQESNTFIRGVFQQSYTGT